MKIDGYDEARHNSDLFTIKWALSRGYFVSKERMASLLRSDAEITPEIRDYIAGLLDESISRPRGQPKGFRDLDSVPTTFPEMFEAASIAAFGCSSRLYFALEYIARLKKVRKARGWPNPHEDAVQRAADKHGFAFEYLNNHWRRGRRTK